MNGPESPRPRVCFLGSARYTRPLARAQRSKWSALRALGEMHVVAFSSGRLPRRFHEEADFYLLPAIPFQIARYALLTIAGTLQAAWLIVTRRIDIVVAQGPYEGVAAVCACVIARFFRRRAALVVESHGDFAGNLFAQGDIRWAGLYRRAMGAAARFSLSRADALRAISSATERQLREWRCTQRIVSFPTWTEIDVFLDSRLSGTVPHPQAVIYAGVLTPGKGLHYLLPAVAAVAPEFPALRLKLVGAEVDPGYALKLRRMAAELEIEERIVFVGAVTQEALAEHLAHASFLVLPTLSEGLGRVIIEAMAMARAVVASDVGGVPDLVEEGRTGWLVPAHDTAALSGRLRWMFTHPEEARQMGLAGRARVHQLFSTASYLRGYAELFDAAREGSRGDDAKTAVTDAEPRYGR